MHCVLLQFQRAEINSKIARPFSLLEGGLGSKLGLDSAIFQVFFLKEAALPYVKFWSHVFPLFNRKPFILQPLANSQSLTKLLMGCKGEAYALVLNMQGFTSKFVLYFATHNAGFPTPINWCIALLIYMVHEAMNWYFCVVWSNNSWEWQYSCQWPFKGDQNPTENCRIWSYNLLLHTHACTSC